MKSNMKNFDSMKNLKFFALLALCASLSGACDGGHETGKADVHGKYLVLNNGAWSKNNASISLFNPKDGSVEANVFENINGQKLGDLGQDILFYGGQYFIAMNGSQCVWKTDAELKVLDRMTPKSAEWVSLSPRSLTVFDGEVYATFQEGYVGSVAAVKPLVGGLAMPEGLWADGNMLYVAESDGYGDGCSASKLGIIEKNGSELIYDGFDGLNKNLQAVVGCAGRIYALSWDIYSADYTEVLSPGKVQSYEPSTGVVSDYALENPVAMAVDGKGILHVLCNVNGKGAVYQIDMATGVASAPLIKDVKNPYSISADANHIYIGTSDYVNTGDVLIYSHDGKLLYDFDCQGINPQKVVYVP